MALTEEQLRAFVPRNYFLKEPYNVTVPEGEEEATTRSYGIPNTNAFTNSGDGGGGGPFEPYTAQQSGDFVTNRTNFGNTGYIQGTEPEETYMDKIGGVIKKGIGYAFPGGNFLMGLAENQARDNRLSGTDNAFIDMQLANQEQNIHGFGNIANQDRYGYNKESMFGNYADKVKERVEIANRKQAEWQKANPNKNIKEYVPRDIDAYYLEKEKEQDESKKQVEFNDWMNQRITANKLRAQQGSGLEGLNDIMTIPDGEDTSTITNQSEGITEDIHGNPWDSKSHAQEMADQYDYDSVADYNESIADIYNEGGRVGYNRGRVVNPGGYAGDDEGGILEWIKSKMGSESETNPTVFGTQNSLLNQGSIAQLKDAIKSYEALMYMGELDEEQQADYELKLNQLEALEQGAQGQAQGGRVGLRYGGLLSIL